MKKIEKVFNFKKIISIALVVSFLFTNSSYGIDMPKKYMLRVPLLGGNSGAKENRLELLKKKIISLSANASNGYKDKLKMSAAISRRRRAMLFKRRILPIILASSFLSNSLGWAEEGGFSFQRPVVPVETSVRLLENPVPIIVSKYILKSKLFSLPGKDIVSILNWSAKSFFNHVYDWYKISHPDISENDFYKYAQGLDSKDMENLVKSYLQSEEAKKYAHLNFDKQIEEAAELISDAKFQETFMELDGLFGLNNADRPYYEVYLIFKCNDLEKQRYLSVLRSKEFMAFHEFLKNKYRINPNNRLIEVLDKYLDPPSLRSYMSEAAQEAFLILRQSFPEVNFDNIEYLSIMPLITRGDKDETFKNLVAEPQNGNYEKKVQALARDYEFISSRFNIRIRSASDVRQLVLDKDSVLKLRNNERLALGIWDFYQKNHPGLLRYDTISEFLGIKGFFYSFVMPFMQLGSEPRQLERFLKIFRVSLQDINLAYTVGGRKIDGKLPAVDYESMVRNQHFRGFVRNLFSRYPLLDVQITEKPFEIIANIIYAFENEDNFSGLNAAIDMFGKKRPMPEFNPNDAGLKIKVLLAVRDKFGSIGLSGKDIFDSSAFRKISDKELKTALDLFDSSVATDLYTALFDNWGLQVVNLNDFLEVLNDKSKRDFYLNTDNARKFLELKERYHIIAIDTSEKESRPQEVSALDEIMPYADDIVKKYAFYMNPEIEQRIRTYFYYYFQDRHDKQIGIQLSSFKKIDRDKAFNNPGFLEIARFMEEEYGVDRRLIGAVFPYNGIPDGYLETLRDEKTKIAFEQLKQFYEGTKFFEYKHVLLNRAVEIKDHADYAIPALNAMRDIGIDMTRWENFKYFVKGIISAKPIAENLTNPDFIKFYKEIINMLYGGINDIKTISELSELYNRLSESQKATLYSTQFDATVSFIRTEFFITDLHSSTLIPILTIAGNFDQTKWGLLLDRLKSLGEDVTANDLILLNEVMNNSALEARLFDRGRLIKDASEIYKREAFPRKSLDEVNYLKNSLEYTKKYGSIDTVTRLKKQIAKIESEYTERPPLETLPNLALLRINLLFESLQSSETLRIIGDIVSRDIHDTTTEYGGTFRSLKNGLVTPNDIKSHSEFDGTYSSPKYGFFIDGLNTFHLHAFRIDTSGYSGPSYGDILYVDFYDVTDVVITSMGHSEGSNSSIDATKLKVNVDIYGMDKRDPGNKRVFIVDLGTFIVPYKAPEAKSVSEALPPRNIPGQSL